MKWLKSDKPHWETGVALLAWTAFNCLKYLQVYLPTGGMVTVRNGYKQFLSVYYKASATDFMQTTGIVNIAHKELVD